jgi:hypothetical protein
MKKLFYLLLLGLLHPVYSSAQNEDFKIIKKLYDNALTSKQAYNQLGLLCEKAPGRLIGTKNSFIAVDLMKKYLIDLGADTVFLQEFSSPAWICHSASASMHIDGKEIKLNIDALGPSASTPENGITAEIIEVKSLDELRAIGTEKIKGKIVFYNRAFDNSLFNTFSAYSQAVDQRSLGPSLALEMGALASITRSVTGNLTDFPHTGSCRFKDKKLPAIAISTNDAEKLSLELKKNPKLKVSIKVDAEDIVTYTFNLIADLKGKEKPEEYIVIGGHLDAWHNTQGAHDDGVGCLQSTEVLRLFKETGINNKRSIRVILFMDEELYQSGGKAYADYSRQNNIKNYFALESDAGGFTPRFFSIDAKKEIVAKIQEYQYLLQPYGLERIIPGGSGVDINPLKEFGVPLSGYRSDWQRYFDMHHCANDTFDKVNLREMQLGSAAMASLIFLVDQFDLAE